MSQSHRPEEMCWTAHPARERSAAAVIASCAVLCASVLVYLAFDGLWWGVGAALLLVTTLNRFYFPSRFQIDDEGITARYLLRRQRLKWKDIRRMACDGHGAYLSSRSRASRLDAYSGMHVLFGRKRDSVVEQLRAHLSGHRSRGGYDAWAP